ncbi:MAG TPA: winged helix-turn-helix transcriptional regulator [Thermoplasmata archaeon]|nr:winged helix-turn-helix transcriptional regulator [Thermoplasmata archaeon]
MRSFKVIRDPEAFQLLADETRRRIIYLLRVKEMTVAQIAEELKLTPQAIYHHIRKLKDADMVEVAREERVDHFIETYYQATAEMFNLAHGEAGSAKVMEQEVREALEALGKLGLKAKVDADVVSKVVELIRCMKEPDADSPITERVNELGDVSYLGKQELLEFISLMTISDKEFEDFLKNYRELRKTLRSIVAEPIQVPAKA